MPGIVALLDEAHAARVERLWEEMEARFGVPQGYPGALPHCTLHLARTYHDVDGVCDTLRELARAQPRFVMRTAGFGVFPGEPPILHLPVVRGDSIDSLNRTLAELLAPFTTDLEPHYRPEHWLPHVTIGHANISVADLAGIAPWLAAQDLAWDVRVEELALGEDTATGVHLVETFPLRG